MAEEGSSARVVRNTLVNGAASVLGVVVFLILTPFMILDLGAEAYGVFTLALTLSFLGGYAAFSDLGVEAATARFIAEARSDRDVDLMNRYASSTGAFFGSAALVLALGLAALAPLFVDLFGVDEPLRDDATWCFVLVATQLLFEMPARTFYAVLEGSQRFTYYQACEVLRILLQAGLYATVLIADLGVAALGGAMAVTSAVVLVLSRTLAHRAVPELRVSPRRASKATLKQLLGYGGGLLALRVIGTLYRQMDRVIIGAALGAAQVTVYEIANKIQGAAQMVQSVASSALVPAAAYARAQALVLQDMFLRGSAYTLAISLPFVGAVLIFAEPLIRTWIDPRYTEATAATRLFAIYLLLASFFVVGTTIAAALGRLRFLVTVNGLVTLLNLGLSIALVGPLGIEGVVLGSVISYALSWPVQLRFMLRLFDASLGHWLRRVTLPQLPGAIVQAATAPALLYLADRTGSLPVVGALALVSIGLSLAAFVVLGLAREHRQALFHALRGALGLKTPAAPYT